MSKLIKLLLELLKAVFTTRKAPRAPAKPEPEQIEAAKPEPPKLVPPPKPEKPVPPPKPEPVIEVPEDEDDVDTDPGPERPTLSKGTDDKETATELQTLLNQAGAKIGVDGDFGPGTEKAIKSFQKSYGLDETGIAGPETWATLDRPLFNATQSILNLDLAVAEADKVKGTKAQQGVVNGWNDYGNLLKAVGDILGLKPSAAVAIMAVESGGKAFGPDGRMVIRFENHQFRKRYGNDTVYGRHFKQNKSKSWTGHKWRSDDTAPWISQHTKSAGQNGEWAVFEFARSLDADAAMKSISMGAGQTMGFNHIAVGYDEVSSMFEAFSKDAKFAVLAVFDFARSNHLMVRHLRAGNWAGFARYYNGTGQPEHYGKLIGDNVDRAKAMGIP